MPESSSHDDRRAHPRYKCVKAIEVTVVRKVSKGFSVDIGQGGVSFLLDTLVSPGMVSLTIPEISFSTDCRVITAQPSERPGFYRHQAQFKEPILTSVLEQLLV